MLLVLMSSKTVHVIGFNVK